MADDPELPGSGCPIRKSPDQSLLSGSPKLIAASHALHRLLAPRHSPCALSSLTIFANTTQQLIAVITRIQLSKNKRNEETSSTLRLTVKRLVNGDSVEPLFAKLSMYRLGGADRDRTDDLRLAKPALSQLSYSPGYNSRRNFSTLKSVLNHLDLQLFVGGPR